MKVRGRRLLAGIAIGALLASCSGDADADAESPDITDPVETTSTDTTAETTSTTEDPQAEVKAEVEEAYLAYWDAWLEIFAAPNPENPLIERHTTGSVRGVTLRAISDMVLNGRSIRPPEDPDDLTTTVLASEVSGDAATLTACLIDGSQIVENATGEVVDDEVVTLHVRATVVLEGHLWKVATSDVLNERSGRWNCDE